MPGPIIFQRGNGGGFSAGPLSKALAASIGQDLLEMGIELNEREAPRLRLDFNTPASLNAFLCAAPGGVSLEAALRILDAVKQTEKREGLEGQWRARPELQGGLRVLSSLEVLNTLEMLEVLRVLGSPGGQEALAALLPTREGCPALAALESDRFYFPTTASLCVSEKFLIELLYAVLMPKGQEKRPVACLLDEANTQGRVMVRPACFVSGAAAERGFFGERQRFTPLLTGGPECPSLVISEAGEFYYSTEHLSRTPEALQQIQDTEVEHLSGATKALQQKIQDAKVDLFQAVELLRETFRR